mgnify:FL=1|jgi:hypothetical protein
MERDRLQTPTIGQFGHLDDKALNTLFNSYLYRAKMEVYELMDLFDEGIDTYEDLNDASSLIDAITEELSDLSSDMYRLSKEMEGRDRIDG